MGAVCDVLCVAVPVCVSTNVRVERCTQGDVCDDVGAAVPMCT